MGSNLLSIYAAVAAMSVTDGSNTPTVFTISETPNKIETAHLPCRILEIFDNRFQTTTAVHRTLSGTSTPHMHVSWAISDLFLLMPEGQGRGVKDVTTQLITYCQNYIDAVAANETLTTNASIEDCKPIPGLYPYPAESETYYFGVLVTLSIKERVQ